MAEARRLCVAVDRAWLRPEAFESWFRQYEEAIIRDLARLEIKPDMIAQATRNGRDAAARFAEDSGTAVGTLRRARQGLFTITDRDPHSPEVKTIRVVSTLEYFLIDD